MIKKDWIKDQKMLAELEKEKFIYNLRHQESPKNDRDRNDKSNDNIKSYGSKKEVKFEVIIYNKVFNKYIDVYTYGCLKSFNQIY